MHLAGAARRTKRVYKYRGLKLGATFLLYKRVELGRARNSKLRR